MLRVRQRWLLGEIGRRGGHGGHDLRHFVLYIQFNYEIYVHTSVLPNTYGNEYIEYTYQ